MIKLFRDLFKGVNSSDGLESAMCVIILCILIPIVMLIIGVLYKILIFVL